MSTTHSNSDNSCKVPNGDSFLAWCRDRAYAEGAVEVCLSPGYELVPVSSASPELEHKLRNFPVSGGAAGFLLAAGQQPSSILPLSQGRLEALTSVASGCSWAEASTKLPTGILEKLFANGMLSAYVGGERLTGAPVPMFIRVLRKELDSSEIWSDSLSQACIQYSSRYRSLSSAELADRLYRFNHGLITPYHSSCDMVSDLQALLTAGTREYFQEIESAEGSAAWHFYSRSGASTYNRAGMPQHKLYVSPTLDDLLPCVEKLLAVLPSTKAHTWKIGRGFPGIVRADKICLYFNEQVDASWAGQMLAKHLDGFNAQGVPFTRRCDRSGLVSEGIDPPNDSDRSRRKAPISWRVWVSQKIAQALLLQMQQSQCPLGAEQYALWTLQILGVDPRVWRVIDSEFWRN